MVEQADLGDVVVWESDSGGKLEVDAINLPRWLEPVGEFELIRLGRDRDGGYLVDLRDVLLAGCLVSLGINDDWTFDADFLSKNEVPLYAFDGSIDRTVLALKLLKAIATRKDVKHKFNAWWCYRRFFSGQRHLYKEMVGLGDTHGYVTLRQILETYAPVEKVFLKVDIEGSEYRLLDDILLAADRICGLTIEFHDVDLHHLRLKQFVEKLPLNIAHVHYNSFAPIDEQRFPLVLEITFSSHSPISIGRVELPHPLDRPSAPCHAPRKIHFIE